MFASKEFIKNLLSEGIGDQIHNVKLQLDKLKAKADPRDAKRIERLSKKQTDLKSKMRDETKKFLKTSGKSVGAGVGVGAAAGAAVYKLKAKKYDDQIKELRGELSDEKSPIERKDIMGRIKTLEDKKRSLLKKSVTTGGAVGTVGGALAKGAKFGAKTAKRLKK